MVRIQRQSALIIQDRLAEILQLEPGVSEVVKKVRVPAPGLDETLISFDRFLEAPLAISLIRLGKDRIFRGFK
jgi:hypothetical protein